jgi:hypothetical protein
MRLIGRGVLLAVVVYAGVLGASAWWARAVDQTPTCPPDTSVILVDSSSHTLMPLQAGSGRRKVSRCAWPWWRREAGGG